MTPSLQQIGACDFIGLNMLADSYAYNQQHWSGLEMLLSAHIYGKLERNYLVESTNLGIDCLWTDANWLQLS